MENFPDLNKFVELSAVFVSGSIVSIFFLYFFNQQLHIIETIESTPQFFLNNEYIVGFIFTAAIFSVGAYVYVFSTRFFSFVFDKLHFKMRKEKDKGHNYWRQFFMAVSFAFFIVFCIPFTRLFFDDTGYIFLFIFLSLILSIWITYQLHHDLLGEESPTINESRTTISTNFNKKTQDIIFRD